MASLATHPALREPRTGLTDEHLNTLAQTYDRVAMPVWIYDLWNRCVYRNRSSRDETDPGHVSFEIVDSEDRPVGRLATRPA